MVIMGVSVWKRVLEALLLQRLMVFGSFLAGKAHGSLHGGKSVLLIFFLGTLLTRIKRVTKIYTTKRLVGI